MKQSKSNQQPCTTCDGMKGTFVFELDGIATAFTIEKDLTRDMFQKACPDCNGSGKAKGVSEDSKPAEGDFITDPFTSWQVCPKCTYMQTKHNGFCLKCGYDGSGKAKGVSEDSKPDQHKHSWKCTGCDARMDDLDKLLDTMRALDEADAKPDPKELKKGGVV